MTWVTQKAGTGIGAGSYGSCGTLLFVRLPFAPDVRLRVGCEASVRAKTDDVFCVQDCDIEGGLKNVRSTGYNSIPITIDLQLLRPEDLRGGLNRVNLAP